MKRIWGWMKLIVQILFLIGFVILVLYINRHITMWQNGTSEQIEAIKSIKKQ